MSPADISGSSSELSSRHIPEMDSLSHNSNISFSFQIPGTAPSDNLLADEDEIDFFRNAGGADISMALMHPLAFSPVHTSPALRMDERKDVENPILGFRGARSSTPENIVDPPIELAVAKSSQKHRSSNQRPKLSLNIGPVIQPISTSPMTSFPLPSQEPLVSAVNVLIECSDPVQESKATDPVQIADRSEANTRPMRKVVEKKEKRSLRPQRKIIEGGIAKSRIVPSKKTRQVASRAVASSALPPSLPEQPVFTEDASAKGLPTDITSSSIFPMTGIAGRLVQYGQKYTDPFRSQIDANGPLENVVPVADPGIRPDSTNQGSSIVQQTTQERSEEDTSNFPVERIVDSLVQYRKKYTDICGSVETNGLLEEVTDNFGRQPEPTNEGPSIVKKPTQELNDVVDDNIIEDDPSKPLTVSQLSPRKQRTQNAVRLPKPTTAVIKRPMAVESTSEEPKLKRSKGDDDPKTRERPTKSVSKGKFNSKPRVPSARSQTLSRKPSATLSGSGSSFNLKKSNSSVVAVASKPAGIRKTKGRTVSAEKQASAFNPDTAWDDDVRLPDKKDIQLSSSSSKLSGSSLQNSRIQNERKADEKTTFKCIDNPRVRQPIEEAQDVESRSTSRSRSQAHKHKFYHPPPDFKVIHAAFDASLAQRKENIQPTVPLRMQWETESRMQERKKFDERVREKEKDKEREDSEKKRLREAEEEREMKELRKKMVVKAHEVPEWYNERPKTKRRREQDLENRS